MANNRFNLELDTLAPTGSITRPAAFIKANDAATIVKGNATHMYAWFDKVAKQTARPEGLALVEAAESLTPAFSASDVYYGHVILVDSVRNESQIYHTESITFDNELPVVGEAFLQDTDSESKTITNARVVNYSFAQSDNLSGVVKAVLTGDFKDSPRTINNPADVQTGTLELTGDDGMKNVAIVLTDASGNDSVAKTISIKLDLTQNKPTQVLLTEGGAALPAFINYHGIKVQLTDSDKDIVGYKVWEKGQAEPADYATAGLVSGQPVDVTVALTLSDGAGLKTVCAKTIDEAGTAVLADEVSVTIDHAAPTATVTGAGEWISNVEGHRESRIHIVVNDGEVGEGKQSGIKSYTLKCNGAVIETGAAACDKDVAITSATPGMKEGANDFELIVVDIAENESTASKTAGVKLDTTLPVASITELNTWYNDTFTIVANTSDTGAGVATIYAYSSTVADDTSCPVGAKAIAYDKAAQTIAISDITWALAQSADNYMHIKVVDAVGNVQFAHAKFGFDNVKPVVDGFAFAKLYYGDTGALLNISYSDATSGVKKMKVTGSGVADPDTDFVAVAATRAVTLTEGDGMKEAKIQVMDDAGNISEVATCQTELDTSKPTGHISLHVVGEDTKKPDHSPIEAVDARIYPTDDELLAGGFEYKLYGTGMGKSASDVEWLPFTKEEGKTYMTITTAAVGEDGPKVFAVIFKDAAGNISPEVTAAFTLDRKLPEPDAINVDFNIISKVHQLRVSGKTVGSVYADEMHFDIDPGEPIVAFKVCAYASLDAANAGSHEDAAIPTAAGSLNMNGTMEIASAAIIQCMIKGADYEAALGGAGHDGAHIVLVYVQDEAKNWSKAVFTA